MASARWAGLAAASICSACLSVPASSSAGDAGPDMQQDGGFPADFMLLGPVVTTDLDGDGKDDLLIAAHWASADWALLLPGTKSGFVDSLRNRRTRALELGAAPVALAAAGRLETGGSPGVLAVDQLGGLDVVTQPAGALEVAAYAEGGGSATDVASITAAVVAGPIDARHMVAGGSSTAGSPPGELWFTTELTVASQTYDLLDSTPYGEVMTSLGAATVNQMAYVGAATDGTAEAWSIDLTGGETVSLGSTTQPAGVGQAQWLATDTDLVLVEIRLPQAVDWVPFHLDGTTPPPAMPFVLTLTDVPQVDRIYVGELDGAEGPDLAVLVENGSGLELRTYFDVTFGDTFSYAAEHAVALPSQISFDADNIRLAGIDLAPEPTGVGDELLIFDSYGKLVCVDPMDQGGAATICAQGALQ